MRERIAIIGGGVAGLTAGYLLNRRHDVVLYEKDGRVGGNAHTIRTRDGLSFDIGNGLASFDPRFALAIG